MAGIYIHIPFCRQACHYCDFHFSTSLQAKGDLLKAIKKEIELRKDYAYARKIDTVYFGGGTPSLLSKDEINGLFDELNKHFSIDADAEITLEANPDDLTKEKLKELSQTPVNRLSIGIQSFSDKDLAFLNRSHNSKAAVNSVRDAQEAGVRNISIDLIYGIQTLTDSQWKRNIEIAFSLEVPHVSCYSLTVEPRTPLHSFIEKGKIKNVDLDKSAEQFTLLMKEMKNNNFIHYEISNFCKKRFESRHNSSYWKGEKYLGLGPSAHSYDGSSRQWNARSNAKYITALSEGVVPFEKEVLTEDQTYNEYVMISLRTMWGIDVKRLKEKFSPEINAHFLSTSLKAEKKNYLKRSGGKVHLTRKGKMFADKIASDLFRT